MTVLRVIAGWPALSFGFVGLAAWALIGAFGISYDDGGLRSSTFWVAQILRAPFWAVEEFLFVFGKGQQIWAHYVLTIALGLVLCLAVDLMVRRAKRARRVNRGHARNR